MLLSGGHILEVLKMTFSGLIIKPSALVSFKIPQCSAPLLVLLFEMESDGQMSIVSPTCGCLFFDPVSLQLLNIVDWEFFPGAPPFTVKSDHNGTLYEIQSTGSSITVNTLYYYNGTIGPVLTIASNFTSIGCVVLALSDTLLYMIGEASDTQQAVLNVVDRLTFELVSTVYFETINVYSESWIGQAFTDNHNLYLLQIFQFSSEVQLLSFDENLTMSLSAVLLKTGSDLSFSFPIIYSHINSSIEVFFASGENSLSEGTLIKVVIIMFPHHCYDWLFKIIFL